MSKGCVVVRQKFKLRLAVSLLVSVLSMSVGLNAHAASRQPQKTPGKSIGVSVKPSAKASGKATGKTAAKATSRRAAGKSKQLLAQGKQAKGNRQAIARSNVEPSRTARRASVRPQGLMPALATASVGRAQVTPVSVDAPGTLVGRTPIASPAASAATGASFGQIYGLHQTQDPLELKSSVALVVDQETNEVLLAKNSEAVLPIASLTKLMTAMVIVESRLAMDETITITDEDIDLEKNSSSRLRVGTVLARGEALHLALMASENRAAHALGRTFPGGLANFVSLMNAKARQLGMRDSHYVDPTGLNSRNQSSAKDLASLVKAAYQQPLIRELSTSPEHSVQVGQRQIRFGNTNSLVKNPVWDIGLQKTGYIVEAGRCLVMQARMAGRKLIMVFLDSSGKYSRQADAERVRRWLEGAARSGQPSASLVSTSHGAS
jgi:serine-type D-Ala-D-Ala endopeptidase (penicillin-binding protein 7)